MTTTGVIQSLFVGTPAGGGQTVLTVDFSGITAKTSPPYDQVNEYYASEGLHFTNAAVTHLYNDAIINTSTSGNTTMTVSFDFSLDINVSFHVWTTGSISVSVLDSGFNQVGSYFYNEADPINHPTQNPTITVSGPASSMVFIVSVGTIVVDDITFTY